MKFAKLAVAALALSATPALANTDVVAGAAVYGPEGNPVGTIVEVQGGTAILDTGTHKVPLGVDSYGTSDKGLVITATKAQLDGMVAAQIAQANAARDAALVAGAAVMDAEHAPLGTIEAVEGDKVTLVRAGEDGATVVLERDYFGAQDGMLMALMTAAQLDAAMAANAPAAQADAEANADASVGQ